MMKKLRKLWAKLGPKEQLWIGLGLTVIASVIAGINMKSISFGIGVFFALPMIAITAHITKIGTR